MTYGKSYAQNSEDYLILNVLPRRFGDTRAIRESDPSDRPIIWDIGANDGRTLSNSRLLYEYGWSLVLIEPDPNALVDLRHLYEGREGFEGDGRVVIIPAALGDYSGPSFLYSVGEHRRDRYGVNTGLLSTLDPESRKRWEGGPETWDVVPVKSIRLPDVYCHLPKRWPIRADVISIDVEGYEERVLEQLYGLPLDALKTRVIVVEVNDDRDKLRRIERRLGDQDFVRARRTPENAIFYRNLK